MADKETIYDKIKHEFKQHFGKRKPESELDHEKMVNDEEQLHKKDMAIQMTSRYAYDPSQNIGYQKYGYCVEFSIDAHNTGLGIRNDYSTKMFQNFNITNSTSYQVCCSQYNKIYKYAWPSVILIQVLVTMKLLG